jgi:hypothetical protein
MVDYLVMDFVFTGNNNFLETLIFNKTEGECFIPYFWIFFSSDCDSHYAVDLHTGTALFVPLPGYQPS